MSKEVKALVTSDSCEHCAEMKSYLKEKGLLDKVKIIRYETSEGKEFCVKNGITAVPECVVITGDKGEKVRVCSEKEFEKLVEDGC